MPTLCFRALIKIHDVNPYVLVSAKRAAKLKPGWRKPMPVLVQINGKPKKSWPINMMPVGDGSFRLYLHGDVRKVSGTGVVDRVSVMVTFDASYKGGPAHPIPSWFRAALTKNSRAEQNWEKLIPSRKKEILRYFSTLKSPEAQERNLARPLRVLSEQSEQVMGRSWSGGK
jgi:hypothetical protein